MPLSILCRCGREVLIHVSQAGTEVRCVCGSIYVIDLPESENEETETPVEAPAPELPSVVSPRERQPEVHVLTSPFDIGRRVRSESLENYVHAVKADARGFFLPLFQKAAEWIFGRP